MNGKNHRSNGGKSSASGGVLLYGRHAAEAAIANKKRIVTGVLCVPENAEMFKALLLRSGREVSLLKVIPKKEIERLLPADAVHQGVVVQAKALENFTLEDVCLLADGQAHCRLLILDQVTDPQNVGAIIRSCAAFGALALVMQDKNSPAESGAMAKASAGTIELVPICRVTNLSRAIEKLKNAGFWVVGMDGYATITLDKMNKNGKIALVMGSEGKGMRRLVEESCDETVRLQTDARVESLNVATAAAIALYEAAKV